MDHIINYHKSSAHGFYAECSCGTEFPNISTQGKLDRLIISHLGAHGLITGDWNAR
jgi:hypothetical protein